VVATHLAHREALEHQGKVTMAELQQPQEHLHMAVLVAAVKQQQEQTAQLQ
jgi:hypothetical protein